MTQSKSMRAIVFSALMLIQVLAPITYAAPSSTPDIILETKVDLGLLSTVEIAPSGELANGWFDPEDGAGEINLLFRDMSVVSLEDWTDWTGQNSKLTGWYVLTHEFPVPSEWFYQLEEAGIDCFSFLPPNGFHCELQGHSVEKLESLEVKGLVQFDSADKVRENLVRGITGLEMDAYNLFVRNGVASANLVLSGVELPEGIFARDDIVLEYHNERYATAIIKPTCLLYTSPSPRDH